jgi:hypothetical protein
MKLSVFSLTPHEQCRVCVRAPQAINTLLGDVPLTLESGIIAKASVEISVKRVRQSFHSVM